MVTHARTDCVLCCIDRGKHARMHTQTRARARAHTHTQARAQTQRAARARAPTHIDKHAFTPARAQTQRAAHARTHTQDKHASIRTKSIKSEWFVFEERLMDDCGYA